MSRVIARLNVQVEIHEEFHQGLGPAAVIRGARITGAQDVEPGSISTLVTELDESAWDAIDPEQKIQDSMLSWAKNQLEDHSGMVRIYTSRIPHVALGNLDFLLLCQYAADHGFALDSFKVGDRHLDPLDDSPAELVKSRLLRHGIDDASQTLDLMEAYIVGVQLIHGDSGQTLRVSRGGYVNPEAEQLGRELLINFVEWTRGR